MYYVYILYSESTGSFYKGQTNNIKVRLHRHNSGFEKATASKRPWTIIWTTEKANRSEAVKLEMKLKNLDRKRLIEFMLKYDNGIWGPDEMLLLEQLSGC